LDVSAELRFQVADVYGTHRHIITNLTMLVMFILVSVHANAESRRKAPAGSNLEASDDRT
jgi:hypothetical protein